MSGGVIYGVEGTELNHPIEAIEQPDGTFALSVVGSDAGIVVSTANSTTTTLTAGATYTGTGEDILNYSQIVVTIYATPSTAKASLYLEFSDNNTNWDISIPALVRDPTFVIPVPLITVKRYFRLRYVNDGGVAAIASLGLSDTAGTPTAQTVMRLTTLLYPGPTKELTRTIDQTLQGSDAVALARSIQVGRTPAGGYQNLPFSGEDPLNSTSTNLAAAATFTGTYFDLNQYVGVGVSVNCNENGTLTIENSHDGITLDRGSSFSTVGGTPFFIGLTKLARYMRLKFENNGASTTTTCRVQFNPTITALNATFQRVDTAFTDASIVQNVRGAIMAENDAGVWAALLRGPNSGLRAHIDSLRTIKCTQQTVGATAAQVTASPLTGRRCLVLKNQSSGANDTLFVGELSSVTSGSGMWMVKGEAMILELDGTASIYVIADGASRTLGIMELAE